MFYYFISKYRKEKFKKVDKNVVVITCSNRKKAIDLAIIKYGIDTVILDDGFSNRKIKKPTETDTLGRF